MPNTSREKRGRDAGLGMHALEERWMRIQGRRRRAGDLVKKMTKLGEGEGAGIKAL